MKTNQADFPVRAMCRVLDLSPSGYYAWLDREPSARAKRDEELTERIQTVWRENRRVYGRPRIYADLKEAGERVGEKRVGRLMKQAEIVGASRRRRGPKTTRRNEDARPAPDLIERDFSADGPDQLWVADITYIPTWAGFLYLAVVLDVWSRRVIGWSMATHLRTELVLDALNMATWQRRPECVIHHSDQGTQYTSIAFGLRCNDVGVRPSMGSVGDAYDNAMCESFFATLECELLDRQRFRTQAKAKMAVSTSSRASTTPGGDTRHWVSCRPSTSSVATERQHEKPDFIASARHWVSFAPFSSPAARGKLSSPQRGGHTINLSVHPSTETGQLQSRNGISEREPSREQPSRSPPTSTSRAGGAARSCAWSARVSARGRTGTTCTRRGAVAGASSSTASATIWSATRASDGSWPPRTQLTPAVTWKPGPD